MRLTAEFREYKNGAWALADPGSIGGKYVLSLLTRPLGGGVTVEAFVSCHVTPESGDDIHRQTMGIFYVTVAESLYTDGTWYEYEATAVVGGMSVKSSRRFYFQSGTEPVQPVANAAYYRVVSISRRSGHQKKRLVVERTEKPTWPLV